MAPRQLREGLFSSSILHGCRVDLVPAGGQRGALQAVVGQGAGLALLAQRPPAPRTLRLALLQTLETRAAGQSVVGPHREAVLGSAVNDSSAKMYNHGEGPY